MKDTIIISGFPGIGKSYLTELYKDKGIIICDSDSSKFSWIEPGIRNPDFPNNYINHIKELIGKVDGILVSSHSIVREALAAANIKYVLVYPDKSLYLKYLKRYVKRNNDTEFIINMAKLFHTFVNQCDNDMNAIRYKMTEDNYLSDIIEIIVRDMKYMSD
jgi:adenylate kinase family enzyme